MILLYNNKKAVLLLATIIFIFSVFAGCSSNKDKQGDNPTVTDSDTSGKNNTENSEKGGESEQKNNTGTGGETDGTGTNQDDGNTGIGPKITDEDKRLIEDVAMENIPVPNEPSTSNYIYLNVDKNHGEVGEVIRAEIRINLAANFAGYQVNIKYDPKVLQAVNYDTQEPFGENTSPTGTTILTNQDFLPMNFASNDINNGILNFGSTYTNYPEYKAAGVADKSGVLAVIGFKVLKKEATVIGFENSGAMPTGKQGTMLFNWDGDRLSSYEIVGVQKIN